MSAPAWLRCRDPRCHHPECVESREIQAYNPEQLTLYLARNGVSPEDTRRALLTTLQRLEDL